ncbi:MAG: DUF4388 domain-containing protein [Myxococcota bacterium]
MSNPSRPRSGRLRTDFGVRIRGVDTGLETRHGDVSLTGIYFELETPKEIGSIGSVQALQIQPLDGGERVEVMGRMVRVRSIQTLHGPPRVEAVAFEFLPENDGRRLLLESLVRRCVDAHTKASADVEIELHIPNKHETDQATIRTLGLQQMTLRSQAPIPPGEWVSTEVNAPRSGMRYLLEGTVQECEPEARGHRVVVELAGRSADEERLIALIDELMVVTPSEAAPRTPHQHLRGDLERVRLMSLLNLFAMDQVTGVLSLVQGTDAPIRVFFREGAVVDAEGPCESPLATVHHVSRWEQGEFVFEETEVSVDDRLRMRSTTALMLELARLDDEEARPREEDPIVEAAARAAPFVLSLD